MSNESRAEFWGTRDGDYPMKLELHYDVRKRRIVLYPPLRVMELRAEEARRLGHELLDIAGQIDGRTEELR